MAVYMLSAGMPTLPRLSWYYWHSSELWWHVYSCFISLLDVLSGTVQSLALHISFCWWELSHWLLDLFLAASLTDSLICSCFLLCVSHWLLDLFLALSFCCWELSHWLLDLFLALSFCCCVLTHCLPDLFLAFPSAAVCSLTDSLIYSLPFPSAAVCSLTDSLIYSLPFPSAAVCSLTDSLISSSFDSCHLCCACSANRNRFLPFHDWFCFGCSVVSDEYLHVVVVLLFLSAAV